uniref:Protein-tyrosine phosphatase n=1 Tax=Steinernema glaseri TaxID=37863 RepID=A0A1I7Y713_9BILA
MHEVVDRDRPISAVQKQMFLQFVKDTLNVGIAGLLKRYEEEIKPFSPPNITRVGFDSNMDKNRYKDVVCIDETRVYLRDGTGGDYIHANYVEGDPLLNRFICAQAPMVKTVRDFWRMIIQERVSNIFMLCETVEEGKPKCEQYWPREVGCGMEWPGVSIKNVGIDEEDTTTITTTLEVTFKKQKMTLQHHQWRTWPDKSVPQSVMAPFRLLKIARWATGPTIVHCSAGIGRTGTVVALEIAIQMALSGRELSMVEVVQRLRSRRGQAVQTDLQFIYMHKCVLAFLQVHKVYMDNMALMQKTAMFDMEYANLLRSREAAAAEKFYSPVVPMNLQHQQQLQQQPCAP